MADKKTYRVKRGYGPHQIIVQGMGTAKAKRVKIFPGDTFNDFPDSKNVQGFEFKLEVLQGRAVVEHEIVKQEEEVKETVDAVGLRKLDRGSGRFDVINEETGEKINNKLLTSKEADELISMGIPEKETVEVGEPTNEKPETTKTEGEGEEEEEEEEEPTFSGTEGKKRREKIK